jgi:hypothetical protein
MNKVYLLFFSVNVLVLTITSNAQSKIWENVSIKKAFETKTEDDTKPAIVSFTFPKDSTDSYLVNAGVGYDFFQAKRKNAIVKSATGFFVYNRNSLVEKKTKNYKLGITGGHLIDINDNPTSAVYGATSVQYMRNCIDTTHSFIATHYWHPMYKSMKFVHIGGYMATPHVIDYFFLPQAGLEYQNIFDANSKQKKGYDARLYFNASLNIRIKKRTRYSNEEIKQNKIDSLHQFEEWKAKTFSEVKDYVDKQVPGKKTEVMPKNYWLSLFELYFSYAGRASFATRNSNFQKYNPLFTTGLNIYPLDNENFSFGISFNDGANPIDGTAKQTFWLFSLNFTK